MPFSERLKQQLRLAESPGGVPVLKPYICSGGYITAGHGHKLSDHIPEEIRPKLSNVLNCQGWAPFSVEDAERWLDEDIRDAAGKAIISFEHAERWEDARWEALIELYFNMGSLREFPNMIRSIYAGDWPRAAKELLYIDPDEDYPVHTKYVNDVGDGRSFRVARQLETGKFADEAAATA